MVQYRRQESWARRQRGSQVQFSQSWPGNIFTAMEEAVREQRDPRLHGQRGADQTDGVFPVRYHRVASVKKTLEFINLEVSAKALKHQVPISTATLGEFLDAASEKLVRMDAVEQAKKERENSWYRNQRVRVSVPRGLCETLGDLLDVPEDSAQPLCAAQVNLFITNFFSRLDNKSPVCVWVAILLQNTDWNDVGQALLSTLTGENMHGNMVTALEVARELESGVAKQELLKVVVENALKLKDTQLCTSNSLENLWRLVLLHGDDTMLENLANKFKEMSPRLFLKTLYVFAHQLRNDDIPDSRFAVLVSIAALRVEWLQSQIQVLEKPFSWEMPVAEFPATAEVQTFLRGPDAKMTTEGVISFETYGANNYAISYASDWKRSREQVNASFDMVASGKESGAFVTITKTRSWYETNQEKLPKLKKELKDLMDRYGGHIKAGKIDNGP